MFKHEQRGFTIVELLIVIVVIAILAAITIVAYNGIQSRANDSSIESTAAEIQKAIQIWYVDTGILPAAGYGSTGSAVNDACPGSTTASGGWFESGPYLCSMQDLLKARGLLTNNLTTSLPKNNKMGSSTFVFMFYPCTNVAGSYVLFWYLNNPDSNDASGLDAIAQKCYGVASGSTLTEYISYGMRAGKIIQLQ